MQTTYNAVVALTDAFCRDRLNDEYRDLARAMTAAPVPRAQVGHSNSSAARCCRVASLL
jgi:hypothetical protein